MALREWRKRAGLTQAELGRRCGRSQQSIARLESATPQNVSMTVLRRVLAALNLTVEERERLILSFFAQVEPPAPAAVSAGVGAPSATADTEQMFQVSALAGAEEAA